MSDTIPYRLPQKQISSVEELNKFLESDSFQAFLKFLVECAESVKGVSNDSECIFSPILQTTCVVLNRMSAWVDGIPLVSQQGRFANAAYKIWFDKMVENADDLMKEILPETHHEAVVELSTYWKASWGDRTRMDYGTGHEMHFGAWLYCLYRLGLITKQDLQAVVLKVFLTYLAVMRKLQTTYWLEPAGSKGVWALDDYHFLPFYFGASQLRGHPFIKPKSVREVDIYETYDKQFMYLACIKYINQVKKGPFFEHSPMLESISNVIHWDKVTEGMMKMYKGDVLCKFPVMQHFLTGGILSFEQ